MQITVVGAGYVGLANALLLAKFNEVQVLDIDAKKVDQINRGYSPLRESRLQERLTLYKENVSATLDAEAAYSSADLIIIATPTDYNDTTGEFDTSVVLRTIRKALSTNDSATIVLKSTLPVGFTSQTGSLLDTDRVICSPEFLREGLSMEDSLRPSRVVIGDQGVRGKQFAGLVEECVELESCPILFTPPSEAEAIKLFSNTYLAMRVSFFNELDSYALRHNLRSEDLIHGIGLDPRIGLSYSNPSFGYGGYCLPKDTKQLVANFEDIPQNLMSAIVASNETRIHFIAEEVLKTQHRVIGVYRLAMKQGSDNFRESSILRVLDLIRARGRKVILFEPNLPTNGLNGVHIRDDLAQFLEESDIILANRMAPELTDVASKVFTRDVYGQDR